MFQVTSGAARQIRAAAVQCDAQGMALRVAARQIADSSLEYGMGFDDANDDDATLDFDGLTMLLAPAYQPMLHDTVLDFVELQPGEYGFIFAPPPPEPDATAEPRTCGSGGCGSCAC